MPSKKQQEARRQGRRAMGGGKPPVMIHECNICAETKPLRSFVKCMTDNCGFKMCTLCLAKTPPGRLKGKCDNPKCQKVHFSCPGCQQQNVHEQTAFDKEDLLVMLAQANDQLKEARARHDREMEHMIAAMPPRMVDLVIAAATAGSVPE